MSRSIFSNSDSTNLAATRSRREPRPRFCGTKSRSLHVSIYASDGLQTPLCAWLHAFSCFEQHTADAAQAVPDLTCWEAHLRVARTESRFAMTETTRSSSCCCVMLSGLRCFSFERPMKMANSVLSPCSDSVRTGCLMDLSVSYQPTNETAN